MRDCGAPRNHSTSYIILHARQYETRRVAAEHSQHVHTTKVKGRHSHVLF